MKGLTRELKKTYEFPVARDALIIDGIGTQTDFDALYRPETEEVLSIVSKDYKLVTHKDAVDPILESLEMVGGFELEKIQVDKLGRRMEIGFVNKEIRYDVDGDGDKISPTFRILNSYDKQYGLTYSIGAFRLVCSNGLRLFRNMERIREFHVGQVDPIRMAGKIEKNLDKFPTLAENYKKMVEKIAKNSLILSIILSRDLTWKIKEAVLEQIRNDGFLDYDKAREIKTAKDFQIRKKFTIWYLYNVFTYLMTHNKEVVKSGYRINFERKFADMMWKEALR